MRNVVSFPVIVPSKEQQKDIVEFFQEQVRLKEQIEELEKKALEINERHWELD